MFNKVETMNKTMMMVAAGILAGGMGSATAAELSGDQATACEALMCLTAVGSAPSECNASLRKYFSLHADKPSDLRKKRRNFLNQCPSDSGDLVNSIVNGQCNEQGCSTPIVGGPTPRPRPPVDTIAR